jgi:hypothetical protein
VYRERFVEYIESVVVPESQEPVSLSGLLEPERDSEAADRADL